MLCRPAKSAFIRPVGNRPVVKSMDEDDARSFSQQGEYAVTDKQVALVYTLMLVLRWVCPIRRPDYSEADEVPRHSCKMPEVSGVVYNAMETLLA